jgi:mycoredoxin-dependent peroxiredoxin
MKPLDPNRYPETRHREARRSNARRARSKALIALPLLLLAACDGEGTAALPDAPAGTEVGEAPPILEGSLPNGDPYALTPARGERTVVLFYRSETCGLCRIRLEQLHGNLAAYRAAGARVVAVTLDPPELSAQTSERLGGEFPVVSVDSAVFESWRVLDTGAGVALPGAYVLDERGVVIFRHLGQHAGDRISDATLLTILESTER